MVFDLTVIWALIIAFAVFAYVVLDGFDLGLGMLFPLFPKKEDRDVMMNSVAPVWDGNETWLVLGGGGLMAAFPLAYAIILPALYAPLIAMLLALIFRGVAFEFRWRTERARWVWDLAFTGGSALAAFSQGVALGGLLQGITVDEAARAYAGGWWDWASPFTLLTGLAVMTGYCLLGSTWLVMKTSGTLQKRARELAWITGIGTVVFMALVSLFTPYLEIAYFERWFTWPNILFTAPVPLAVAGITFLMFKSLTVHHHEYRPFVLALCLFLLGFIGLGISMWPYVIPTQITIWEAATVEKSQLFMLVGVAVMVPLILAYTAYAYWVFRGKVDPQDGYH